MSTHSSTFAWRIPWTEESSGLPSACMHAKSFQLCLTLLTPWTVAARLLQPWDSPGKNTGMGCHALFQGTFPAGIKSTSPASPALVSSLSLGTWEARATVYGVTKRWTQVSD